MLKKFNHAITIVLLVIGFLFSVAAIVTLFIWLTDMSQFNFVIFVSSLSAASIWMLLTKISHYLDGKFEYPEEPEVELPDYLED